MVGNKHVTCRICLRYKCEDCTYSTNRFYNLRRHEKAMHKLLVTPAMEIKKMYKCEHCTYSTKRSTDLRRHKKAMHKTLVTEKIKYHSTLDVAALKNKIVQSAREYKKN